MTVVTSQPLPQFVNTITVYGSAQVSVEPDIALLNFSIEAEDEVPRQALKQVYILAQQVHQFLINFQGLTVEASNVVLSEQSSGNTSKISRKGKSQNYSASIKFHVIVHNLKIVEEILVGLIEVDVVELASVKFQSSKLQELALQARQHALENAHLKAKTYTDTLNVQVGEALSIEEIEQNPTNAPIPVFGFRAHDSEAENALAIINPNYVNISAHIQVIFAIK